MARERLGTRALDTPTSVVAGPEYLAKKTTDEYLRGCRDFVVL